MFLQIGILVIGDSNLRDAKPYLIQDYRLQQFGYFIKSLLKKNKKKQKRTLSFFAVLFMMAKAAEEAAN